MNSNPPPEGGGGAGEGAGGGRSDRQGALNLESPGVPALFPIRAILGHTAENDPFIECQPASRDQLEGCFER